MRPHATSRSTLSTAFVALVFALASMALPRDMVAADAAGRALAVIVHPAQTDSVSVADLTRIYLRQHRFWKDGSAIVPLNRETGSPEREAFSARVLGSETKRLAAYWNARYFEGVFPPAVLASGEAVKRYVATDRGAIGYIDAREIDASVLVVLTLTIEGARPPSR